MTSRSHSAAAGAVVDGVDHPSDAVLDALGVQRARLGHERAALGHDVGRLPPRRGQTRRWPCLARRSGPAASRRSHAPRRGSRCGRPPAAWPRARRGHGTRRRSGSRSARRSRSRRSGSRGRRRSRSRLRSLAASNAFAPAQRVLLPTVNSSSSPTGEPSISSGGRSRGSRRRRPCCRPRGCRRSRSPSRPRPRTGSICAASDRVEVGAQEQARSVRPGMRASRLPLSVGLDVRAPHCAATPRDLRGAPLPRRPDGLGIGRAPRTSRRAAPRSASLAGRTPALQEAAGHLARVGRLGPARAERLVGAGSVLRAALLRVARGGADELAEQRRGPLRARLELRVELRRHEERVVGELDDLDQPLVRRGARSRPAQPPRGGGAGSC